MIMKIILFLLLVLIGLILSWYHVWQWESMYLGKKILVHEDGWKLRKFMYLGEAKEYGSLFYDGISRILFFKRGLWCCYKTIKDPVTLLHLAACYHFSPWVWKGSYISWCGLHDLDRYTELNKAVRLATRHIKNTPMYLISSTGEKYRNTDYYPQAQDICDAFLWLRNYYKYGDTKWRKFAVIRD